MSTLRAPPVPQHCPTPARARRPRAAGQRRARAARPAFNEPGQPGDPRPAAGGRRRRAPPAPSSWSTPRACRWPGSACPAATVEPLTHAQYGPFRRLYLTPAQVREQYAGRTFVPVTDALTERSSTPLAGAGPAGAARAGRHRHARRSPPSRCSAPPWPPPATCPTPSWWPCRSPPTATPTADHDARRPGRRATTPASDPVRRARPTTTATSRPLPRRHRRHRRRRPPAAGRAGPGAVLHRPVRQRQVHAGPRADGPAARAGRAAPSPASTATSCAGTSPPG